VTPRQAAVLEVGSKVQLVRKHKPTVKGRVTQATRLWFMITWYDGSPEVIRRDQPSSLLEQLEQVE
jgi:hypothetical protein